MQSVSDLSKRVKIPSVMVKRGNPQRIATGNESSLTEGDYARAHGIIKSYCVLLCALRVIDSIVLVDIYRDYHVRRCGPSVRGRHDRDHCIALRIVDFAEYHNCNQTSAARAT